MNKKFVVSALVVVLAMLLTLTAVFAADQPAISAVDATLGYAPEMYAPTAKDLAYSGVTAGDVAEADIRAVGTSLQYTGLVLNGDGVNAGSPHPFLKVQQQGATGSFEYAGCYLGNNGSAGTFGLGFFALSQPFNSAHMRASRVSSTVTIEFTNVNGGSLPDQTYTCAGAPAAPGDKIGVLGYANIAKIDNFSDGATVLDTFSYVGALGTTGNWNDAAPGMNADGSQASGGPGALSFWVGQACAPASTDAALNPNLSLSVSAGSNNVVWLVRFYFANGTSQNVLQTGLPACFSQTFNTNYIPTNPPITSICSFIYDPTVPGVIAQDCVAVP